MGDIPLACQTQEEEKANASAKPYMCRLKRRFRVFNHEFFIVELDDGRRVATQECCFITKAMHYVEFDFKLGSDATGVLGFGKLIATAFPIVTMKFNTSSKEWSYTP